MDWLQIMRVQQDEKIAPSQPRIGGRLAVYRFLSRFPRGKNTGDLRCASRGFRRANLLVACSCPLWAKQDCVLPREAALNEDARQAESTAVRGIKTARLVDFADKLCTGLLCQSVIDGEVVFRDSNHLTSNFARKLAPFLEREMELALSAPNGSGQTAQISP